MVRLVTASNAVEARIIAARLGAEGIVWQLQGPVDGPLAVGPVEILVDEEGYEAARELLLADDVESAFDPPDPSPVRTGTSGRDLLWLIAVAVLVVLFVIVRTTAIV